MVTDLEKVKQNAIVFLYTDIKDTPVPFLAHHPFTNSWITMDAALKSIIDLHDSAQADLWRKDLKKDILTADLHRIFCLLNPPYILQFLKHIEQYLSNDDLAMILNCFWQSIENISTDPCVSGRTLVKWFKRSTKKSLMNTTSFSAYENLPNQVTVYRGVTSFNKKNKQALSWTLSYDIAKWFANRYNSESGEIWKLNVPKERILCFFNCDEQEVIVNLYGYKTTPSIEEL